MWIEGNTKLGLIVDEAPQVVASVAPTFRTSLETRIPFEIEGDWREN
jgi:hypothetical protein